MKKDWSLAKLSERDRTLLAFSAKLTLHPNGMSSIDVAELRAVGFSDIAILEATHICGFFNHINRVADALGVDPEAEWVSREKGSEADPNQG